ncbi:MAG: hypothetical protein A2104_02500 [Candidatus Melainabacteria bacterium GWF2_32_7]|nr:MAG: hypothetical protein A2104_02500 [Candidatus Melainabacteria bacterium GWF2_32_7]
MRNEELLRGLVSTTSVANGINKKEEVSKKSTSSIFGDNFPPKFENIFEKSSEIFGEFNETRQLKRNERLRKEMEERELKPTIEDEILDAFINVGKSIKKGVKSLFSKDQSDLAL